ncbi:hypothetical protein GW17_00034873 [Ensete ventricosum]|uniref:Uncharacterized protein n=1 Tax=Ensete ventricosum TaxID=4639 RepID=A0A444DVC0_ENSVE|nr:hypothetical protein B296_00052776 [Ensete ventricosum]RWW02056.1 hypothetical protein GW17_00034873 [Ensete ventricosum]RZR99332.1 hypothetical protein BHM03_00028851 [Ensete ventricosum]
MRVQTQTRVCSINCQAIAAARIKGGYPERVGQPECEPNTVVSLRGSSVYPGEEPICIFYSRYGICKFGTHCKFDHPMAAPMGIYAYGLATSSLTDVAAARNLLVTSSGPPSFQAPLEVATGKSRRLLFADSLQIASSDERIKSEGSQATSSNGKLSSF